MALEDLLFYMTCGDVFSRLDGLHGLSDGTD
jgi:hypothetical protein